MRFAFVLLLLCSSCFGGCFLYVDFSSPAAAQGEALGAYATVRVLDCKGKVVEKPTLTVTAEGLVDGKRISVPLFVQPLRSRPASAIIWNDVPRTGTWALHVQVSDAGEYFIDGKDFKTWSVIPRANSDGVARRALLLEEPATPAQVDDVLRQMSIHDTIPERPLIRK